MTDGINRRRFLVGGGVGVGLIVAWGLWPRDYAVNLVANPGESVFGAWLKIGNDGHVTVAVPQAEHGQGVYTVLPQIVADELGADWRTVAVEPAPLNPLYANPQALHDLFEGLFDTLPEAVRTGVAGPAPMLTGGSSSVRMFEEACRQAGGAARALLCMAAAKRWDVDWQQCRTEAGFVVNGKRRIRFAELAEEAAKGTVPEPLSFGVQGAGKLVGQSVPRIDVPSKVDGSANFAGDVRLADMVHAAIRQGPVGDSRLVKVDRAAADRIRGVLQVVETPRWVAAVATTWWAAQQALDALAPRFETVGKVIDSASIDAALDAALDGPGTRMAQGGDLGAVFKGARLVTATYRADLSVHAPIETASATAAFREGRLELWLATQAPGLARAAAARAAGLSESAVVVHPMLIGGSFGAALEHQVAEQAAVLAVTLKRPVSLVWSRGEDALHDRYRPAAAARMAARLAPNGRIMGWSAKIAAPATGAELARRLMPGATTDLAVRLSGGDRYAVAGALPPYAIPAYAIDHHAADIGVPTGHVRGGAHGYTAFFNECFLDELAHVAGSEPMSYRIGMLGGGVRLARCLSTAAALGGWGGGVPGSGQGIAAHAFRGSYIAVLAEAHMGEDQRPVVDRLVAAVDCGTQINPDIVAQAIEGGLIFGLASALGASTGFTRGLADARGFGELGLPRLADTPDITVEVIRSDEAPGGVSELGVPAVAPAIANALQSATGFRHPEFASKTSDMTLPPDHPPIPKPKIGVLLMNLGTPDGPDAKSVKRYLGEFLSDRRVVEIPAIAWQPILRGIILNTRPKKSAHAYAQVWREDGSPLAAITRAQAVALKDAFGPEVLVDWAMRYGNPDIASRLQAMKAAGCERILLAPLYPQYCAATTATANDKAFAYLATLRWQPAIRTLPPYHDDAGYIDALKASVEASLAALDFEPDAIVASFHGMPKRTLQLGDPYHCHCQKTARLLGEALKETLGGRDLTIAFQSRFGPQKWLGPATDETLVELARAGKTKVAIFAPGFSADCLETLEELAIRGRESFEAAGGTHFAYLPCLNDSAVGVEMLHGLVTRELEGWVRGG